MTYEKYILEFLSYKNLCYNVYYWFAFIDTWDIQIPEDLFKEGEKFMVEDLKPSDSGSFYRIFGAIQAIK